jgi:hypothetical protein
MSDSSSSSSSGASCGGYYYDGDLFVLDSAATDISRLPSSFFLLPSYFLSFEKLSVKSVDLDSQRDGITPGCSSRPMILN